MELLRPHQRHPGAVPLPGRRGISRRRSFGVCRAPALPGLPPTGRYRVQNLLDGCIIATALLFASWATMLGPLYRSHQGDALKQVISLAYPTSDVVMVSLVVILISRAGQRAWISLGLVMAGVVAFAVADSSFSYLTEVNNYGNGNVLDTGWVAGYLLIGLGALWATVSPPRRVEVAEVSTVSLVAPYVPVLVVLAVTSIQPPAWSTHRAGRLVHGVGAHRACPRPRRAALVGPGDRDPSPGSHRGPHDAPGAVTGFRCPVGSLDMTGPYGSGRSSGRTVSLLSPSVGMHPSSRLACGSSRPVGSTSGSRLSAWIVRSVIVATTAFALFDLSLLVSSVHH